MQIACQYFSYDFSDKPTHLIVIFFYLCKVFLQLSSKKKWLLSVFCRQVIAISLYFGFWHEFCNITIYSIFFAVDIIAFQKYRERS